MPQYLLEFQWYDYMIGSLFIQENGKSGMIEENIDMSHTIKSYLYYFFE